MKKRHKTIEFKNNGHTVRILKFSKPDFNDWGFIQNLMDEKIRSFVNSIASDVVDLILFDEEGTENCIHAYMPFLYSPESDGGLGKAVKDPLTLDVNFNLSNDDETSYVIRYNIGELVMCLVNDIIDDLDESFLQNTRKIQQALRKLADSMDKPLAGAEAKLRAFDAEKKSRIQTVWLPVNGSTANEERK